MDICLNFCSEKRKFQGVLSQLICLCISISIYRDRDIEIYKICVEVFEKTVSPTGMIDHSFERKFYEACHRLC